MSDPLDGRIGEAWAGDRPNGSHLNVVLARRGSPTAAAIAMALASPRPGHTPFLACLTPGTVVRPVTVVVNKTTIEDDAVGRMVWGAVQLGIAQGVLDAVADDVLAAGDAAEVVVLVAAWADAAADDESAVRRSTRAAMRAAVADALAAPSADAVRALVERREDAANPYYTGD